MTNIREKFVDGPGEQSGGIKKFKLKEAERN
jgi:hypothetical protein